ncbi:hypothetical protein TUM4637_21110 [Shewanella hafniensis]|nr:hypothetical protein TUM4637_21110 [Shewanella hafniensis]
MRQSDIALFVLIKDEWLCLAALMARYGLNIDADGICHGSQGRMTGDKAEQYGG